MTTTTSLGQQMAQESVDNLNKNVTRNYSGRGWEGENYKKERIYNTSIISKLAREFVKKQMPGYKFSITTSKYSGGSSISIELMSAPHPAFETPNENLVPTNVRFSMPNGLEHAMKSWEYNINKGNSQVNHYYIDNAYYLTEQTREALKKIYNFINSYNYDDSDAQTDYFDTNFYVHMGVGKWDKPFTQTLSKSDMELLKKCDGKHDSIEEIINCKSCEVLLK